MSIKNGTIQTCQLLNGSWEFRLDPEDVGLEEGWFKSEAEGDWTTLEIPSMWQVAGYPEYNGWAWYRLRFQAEKRLDNFSLVSSYQFLIRFHGVSYWSKIWLNDHYIGAHEGHFAPFEFLITELLQKENTLVVRCGCPLEPWQETVKLCGGKDKRTTLGALQDWDCIPYPTRMNPSGIWQDVLLESTGPAFIRHADLATLDHDFSGKPDHTQSVTCQIELRTTIVNLGPRRKDAWLRVTFTPRNHKASTYIHNIELLDLLNVSDWPIHERDQSTELEDIEQEVRFRFEVPDVYLWWPWDLGPQNLYEVTVELFFGDELSHRTTFNFGFRTVQKGLNDPAIDRWNWALFINGVRFFARGSNYLSDQFPSRMTDQRYREDVQLAKDANMNMLRVFATVERPEFYDVCDEQGMLVYQDFPLQWRGYTHTDEFSRTCQRQAVELVHLLYNHPSVFLYGGHSEPWNVNVMREIDKPMTTIVRALDPTRPAIFENGTGPEHDLHAWQCGWYGGHIDDIDSWCEGTSAGFIGEFGAQSFPSLEQLYKYPSLTEEDLNIPINISKLELLNCQPHIFERYLGLERRRDPIEIWIERSQAYQSELLKRHIETFRKHKYRWINGALTFHFIDNYPGVNWSIVDYWRIPKPAYYAVQKAFRPLHIMASQIKILEIDDGFRFFCDVWVVNDSQQAHPDCVVCWSLLDPRMHEIDSGKFEGSFKSDELVQVGSIHCSLSTGIPLGHYALKLELRGVDDELLSDNDYGFDINITHIGSSHHVA